MRGSIFYLLSLLFFLFYSCKKDELSSGSITDPKEIIKNISAYEYIPINLGDFISSDVGALPNPSRYPGLPALLSTKAPTDGEIIGRIEVNQKLIDTYDSIYNTKSPRLTEGLFKVVNEGRLKVKKGDDRSVDSLKIEIGDSFKSKDVGVYEFVVPIIFESPNTNLKLKSRLVFYRYKVNVVKDFLKTNRINNAFETYQPFPVDFSVILANYTIPYDVKIEMEAENNPIYYSDYNKMNNTDYIECPDKSFSFENNLDFTKVTFPYTKPAKYLKFNIIDENLLSFTKNYLKILKIKSINSVPMANDYRIYVITRSNRIDPLNPKVAGQVVNRNNWQLTASSNYSSSAVISKVIDGDNSTPWGSTSTKPHWFSIDMGSENTINGFEFVPNYKYRSEDILSMQISTSSDNLNWENVGMYNGTVTLSTSTASTPDYKYVKFKEPITARYYRFTILKSSSNYAGLAEINAFK